MFSICDLLRPGTGPQPQGRESLSSGFLRHRPAVLIGCCPVLRADVLLSFQSSMTDLLKPTLMFLHVPLWLQVSQGACLQKVGWSLSPGTLYQTRRVGSGVGTSKQLPGDSDVP